MEAKSYENFLFVYHPLFKLRIVPFFVNVLYGDAFFFSVNGESSFYHSVMSWMRLWWLKEKGEEREREEWLTKIIINLIMTGSVNEGRAEWERESLSNWKEREKWGLLHPLFNYYQGETLRGKRESLFSISL
jgi:hypothetical protein